MIYLDTSWLVKLYVEEPDAATVRTTVAGDDLLLSDLAYAEFHSAIWSRRRDKALTARDAATIIARFVDEWLTLPHLALSTDVVVLAADLVRKHPLRTLDALHLASALTFAAGAPSSLRFGSGDVRLVAAAKAEGLITLSVG